MEQTQVCVDTQGMCVDNNGFVESELSCYHLSCINIWPLNIRKLSNIRSRVQSPYNTRCLIRKKACDCPTLMNTRTLFVCMLVFWIMLENTNEKRDCLNVQQCYGVK